MMGLLQGLISFFTKERVLFLLGIFLGALLYELSKRAARKTARFVAERKGRVGAGLVVVFIVMIIIIWVAA